MDKNITYNVGDKVRFRTRELSFHACKMAGTATSTCLNDYPEQEAIGTIKQIIEFCNMYTIHEESGFLCCMVFPEDIITIIA